MKTDYRVFYHLEQYLFDIVRSRFRAEGELGAFDLFCVVIWKANRSKSKVAARLLETGAPDLETAARRMTREIAHQPTPRDPLQVLLNRWNLRLPMATAILTVCYPEDFTVYDVRVCGVLGDFTNLGQITSFTRLWNEYQRFKTAVEDAAPSALSLRDKDRWLWGRSFADQLENDLARSFKAVRMAS